MKNFIAVITFLLLTTNIFAQQNIVAKVSSTYFNTNGITDLTVLNRLNDSLVYGFYGKKYTELMDISIDEISNNLSYHKIFYTVSIPLSTTPSTNNTGNTIPSRDRNTTGTRTGTGSTRTGSAPTRETNERKWGLLKISWLNKYAPTKSIEDISQSWIKNVYEVYEKNEITVEYVKNDKVDGSFILDKGGNNVSFIILSKNKPEMVRGDITINLPESERSKFARDFIQSISFEPTTTTPGGGSTRTTGGRTRGGR